MNASGSSSWKGLAILCGVGALVVLEIWTHTSISRSTNTPVQSPPVLANGAVVGCTDRYQTAGTMGALEDGRYLHYLCHDGKLTRWWVDDSAADEMVPPG